MAGPFNITPNTLLANADLAIDLLNLSVGGDVVGIFDAETLRQLFTGARPMRASVREMSKIMDYPVETGVILSDHHVILPTEIELSMLIPAGFYRATYQQLQAAMQTAKLLSVQTKAGVYQNMVIAEMPHEEDPEIFDALALALRLKEVQFQVPVSIAKPNAPANYSPVSPPNQTTVARGQQSQILVTVPASVLSYVQAAYAWGR